MKAKGIFDKFLESLQSVAHAFVGDLVYGQVMGKEQGATASAVSHPVAAALGAQLKARWLPSFDDEAAFQLALAGLTSAEAAIIANRVEAMGDPGKSDTPEARTFRKIIVTLPDNEQRVQVLREFAKQDDEGWLKIAKITGAATAGQWVEVVRLAKQYLGMALPTTIAAVTAVDQKASTRVASVTGRVQTLNDRLRARLQPQQAALDASADSGE